MTMDNKSATEKLATFVTECERSRILPQAIHEAKRAILGFFGCAVAGSRDPAWAAACKATVECYRDGTATVIGLEAELPLPEAIFLNAAASNVLDFDDTHSDTIIHPAAPIVPVLLGLAEQQVMSGRTLLEATVLAFEVMCRVGIAAGPDHYKGGWHITATCGVFGAATAASLARGASGRQLANALGIAAGQGAMLLTNLAEMAKFVGVGNAARNGYLAAHYAEAGMTSSRTALEGRFGFFEVMGMGEPQLSALDGLGVPWEINKNMHKPYPVGVVLNSVITACLRLRETPGFAISGIREIHVVGHPLLVDRTDRTSVASIADARLSTQHTTAVTLLRGEAVLSSFMPEAFGNAEIMALARKVTVKAREGIDVSGVEMTVIHDRGDPIRIVVEDAKGSLKCPMSDDELVEKTIRLCQYGAPGFDPAPVIEAIWALESAKDASGVLSSWRKGQRRNGG